MDTLISPLNSIKENLDDREEHSVGRFDRNSRGALSHTPEKKEARPVCDCHRCTNSCFHLCQTLHSVCLVSSAKETGPGLLDAAARALQPNRASCTVPRVIVHPPGESPPFTFSAVGVRTPAQGT